MQLRAVAVRSRVAFLFSPLPPNSWCDASRYYCVRRGGHITAARGDVTRLVGENSEPPRFSFGSMALLALYAAFDMRQVRSLCLLSLRVRRSTLAHSRMTADLTLLSTTSRSAICFSSPPASTGMRQHGSDGTRVGFAPKWGFGAGAANGSSSSSTVGPSLVGTGTAGWAEEEVAGCVAPVSSCRGAQYRNATNHCADPPCERFFFQVSASASAAGSRAHLTPFARALPWRIQEVDPITRTCRIESTIVPFVYFAFGACVLAELALHVWHSRGVALATGGGVRENLFRGHPHHE